MKKVGKKILFITILFMAILPLAVACGTDSKKTAAPSNADKITVKDDAGRSIHLDKPLKKVVVFNKFNSEIIRALGKTDTIIGIDEGTLQDNTYWPGWTKKMLAGKGQTEIDYEKVAVLKPEAVILPKNGSYEECEKKLKSFGIKVIVVTGWENKEYAKQIEIMGKIFGEETKAKEYTEFCQKQVDLLKKKLSAVKQKKTIYLENNGEYKTCLPGSGWNDMITMAGGKNIFTNIDITKEDQSKGSVHSFSVDPENIIARNPDSILLNVYDSKAISGTSIYVEPDPAKTQEALKAVTKRPGWGAVTAIKNHNIYGISAFAGNGCFKIVGATYLAKYLYPEEMKDINPDDFFKDWLEKYQGMKFQSGHTVKIK